MTTDRFDSNAWKSQRGAADLENKRGAMVASVEKALHPGMTRGQVVQLLGEPDTSDDAQGIDTYELGVAAYGIDQEFYEIRYANDQVVSHRWSRR